MSTTLLFAITALSTLISLLAAAIMYNQARNILLGQREIALLETQAQLAEQATAISRQRITVLEGSIELQQTHLDLLVERNGELEDRNAYLERVLRHKFLVYVLGLPPMDGPLVMGEKAPKGFRLGPISSN